MSHGVAAKLNGTRRDDELTTNMHQELRNNVRIVADLDVDVGPYEWLERFRRFASVCPRSDIGAAGLRELLRSSLR
jgi:hypothetical protein